MPFGQIVIGPAGAGKSTFCTGMQQLLQSLGRQCHVINLDPGNMRFPPVEDAPARYTPAIDVTEICSQWDLMGRLSIGPNAGIFVLFYSLALVEAMRMLVAPPNSTWFLSQLQSIIIQKEDGETPYFIFDFPGQAELITNEPCLSQLIALLEKNLQFRLVAICLIDASTAIFTKERLVSSRLLALAAMASIELPFINVFSKTDLLTPSEREDLALEREDPEFDNIAHNFDSATTGINAVDSNISGRFVEPNAIREDIAKKSQQRLWSLLEELVEDLPYLHHMLVAVEDKDSMLRILRAADRANGYIFGGLTQGNDSIMEIAAQDL